MSRNYGTMCSFPDAIKWVECQMHSEMRDRVLARMRYEFDKSRPLAPVLHRGIYGKRYDYYTCSNCGSSVSQPTWNYCPNCGRKLSDAYLGRRKTQEEQDGGSGYEDKKDNVSEQA